MEGIRDLAVATFGSMPVRLARPKEIDGLFDDLRSSEFSSAIGLVMHTASAYTPYEIDVNKRVRHSNEIPLEKSNVDFRSELEIPIAPSQEEITKKETMIQLPAKKEKSNDEANSFNKFWNWATQLF